MRVGVPFDETVAGHEIGHVGGYRGNYDGDGDGVKEHTVTRNPFGSSNNRMRPWAGGKELDCQLCNILVSYAK
jgi:hypothetical protein